MEISNRELLAIATKVEGEGKIFYKELAKQVTDAEVKDFLLLMSKEEAQHEKQFKKLLDGKGRKQYGWEENKKLRELIDKHYQTDIFPSIDEIFEHLPQFEGIQKALDFAVESEKVSTEFYGLMQESCHDIEGKTLLLILEKVELEHLQRVEALRERYLKEPDPPPNRD